MIQSRQALSSLLPFTFLLLPCLKENGNLNKGRFQVAVLFSASPPSQRVRVKPGCKPGRAFLNRALALSLLAGHHSDGDGLGLLVILRQFHFERAFLLTLVKLAANFLARCPDLREEVVRAVAVEYQP